MRNNILLTLITLFVSSCAFAGDYEKYFTSERLRIDLVFGGNAKQQQVFLDGLVKESIWSGSKNNLVEKFGYGEYKYELFSKDNILILSKGFNSLFQEWRTTPEAKVVSKSFSGVCYIPFPKDSVRVVISERDKNSGKFKILFEYIIDPLDKLISKESGNDFYVREILYNGNPTNKVDLVFVAEGYKKEEINKFRADVIKFTGYLFNIEPYKSRKSDFNIWSVESISEESGTDIPHANTWKRTVANSNFYTFRIDRYLTAPDQKLISQIVSNSPCDAVYIIVNTNKYGGGGIYNFYGLSMSDHVTEAEVFVHELGHSFAGLGDEYFESAVTYENFYNLKTEPWEPNLTTLVNFNSKWKDMINNSTPVPTPNSKQFNGITGLFEGGGYMAKGVYRPFLYCRMRTNSAPCFCPVCVKAINDMIDNYTK